MRELLPAERFIYEMFMNSSVKPYKIKLKLEKPPADFEVIKPCKKFN